MLSERATAEALKVSDGSQRGRERKTCTERESVLARQTKTDEEEKAGGKAATQPVMDDRPVITLITWQDACKTLRKYFLSRSVGSAAKVPDVLPLYGREETLNPALSSCRRPAICTFLRNVQHVSARDHFRAKLCNDQSARRRHVSGGFFYCEGATCLRSKTKSKLNKQCSWDYSIKVIQLLILFENAIYLLFIFFICFYK